MNRMTVVGCRLFVVRGVMSVWTFVRLPQSL